MSKQQPPHPTSSGSLFDEPLRDTYWTEPFDTSVSLIYQTFPIAVAVFIFNFIVFRILVAPPQRKPVLLLFFGAFFFTCAQVLLFLALPIIALFRLGLIHEGVDGNIHVATAALGVLVCSSTLAVGGFLVRMFTKRGFVRLQVQENLDGGDALLTAIKELQVQFGAYLDRSINNNGMVEPEVDDDEHDNDSVEHPEQPAPSINDERVDDDEGFGDDNDDDEHLEQPAPDNDESLDDGDDNDDDEHLEQPAPSDNGESLDDDSGFGNNNDNDEGVYPEQGTPSDNTGRYGGENEVFSINNLNNSDEHPKQPVPSNVAPPNPTSTTAKAHDCPMTGATMALVDPLSQPAQSDTDESLGPLIGTCTGKRENQNEEEHSATRISKKQKKDDDDDVPMDFPQVTSRPVASATNEDNQDATPMEIDFPMHDDNEEKQHGGTVPDPPVTATAAAPAAQEDTNIISVINQGATVAAKDTGDAAGGDDGVLATAKQAEAAHSVEDDDDDDKHLFPLQPYVCRLCNQEDKEVAMVLIRAAETFEWTNLYDTSNNQENFLRQKVVGHSKKAGHRVLFNFVGRNMFWSKRQKEGKDTIPEMLADHAMISSRESYSFDHFCKYLGGTISQPILITYVGQRFGEAHRSLTSGSFYTDAFNRHIEDGKYKDNKEMQKQLKRKACKILEEDSKCMLSAIKANMDQIADMDDLAKIYQFMQDVFVGSWYKESLVYKPSSHPRGNLPDDDDEAMSTASDPTSPMPKRGDLKDDDDETISTASGKADSVPASCSYAAAPKRGNLKDDDNYIYEV